MGQITSDTLIFIHLYLPLWMDGGKHKNGQNNIQALRRKRKGRPLLAYVTDKSMTY